MLRKQFSEFQVREYGISLEVLRRCQIGKCCQGPILGTSAASPTGTCARTFRPETWRFHKHFLQISTPTLQIHLKGGYAAAAASSGKRSEVQTK